MKICDRVPEPVKRNLENDVIQGMIQDGEPVYGYRSPEYVKDVGTVDRIQQTLKDIERGFIAEKSLSRKQKCIFLDRDGTINQYRGLVYKELSSLLGKEGVFLDDILFCPHHPDKGYPEENPAYKITCECRKPKTGLIGQAAEKYNIDLSGSWMVGDTTMDIQTGINAGMRTALVLTGEAGKDKKYDVTPDLVCRDLLEAVEKILEMD